MPLKRHGPSIEKLIAEIPENLRARIPQALDEIGTIVDNEMRVMLNTPGRGRLRGGNQLGRGSFRTVHGVRKLVRRGAPRTKIDLTNRASAPGEPPAPDFGTLLRSVTHEIDGDTVRGGSPLEYALPLEEGTVTAGRGHRTVIRPYIRPSVTATRSQQDQVVLDLLKRSTSRGDIA
jgi:hypothetical protein